MIQQQMKKNRVNVNTTIAAPNMYATGLLRFAPRRKGETQVSPEARMVVCLTIMSVRSRRS